MFVTFAYLLLTIGISFLNANSVGRYWTEKEDLPTWMRFMMWCGAIMATCGFFVVYVSIITMVMHDLHLFEALAMSLFKVEMTAAEAEIITQNIFDLSYLIIIFPVLGTGLCIWINSLAVAFIRRDFGSVAVAGWNTFAQVRNTMNAVRYVPQATKGLAEGIGKMLKKKDSATAIVYLLLFLFPIVISLGGAIATTAIVIKASDEKYELEDVAALAK